MDYAARRQRLDDEAEAFQQGLAECTSHVEKVKFLNAKVAEHEAFKRDVEARSKRLDAINTELAQAKDRFDQIDPADPSPANTAELKRLQKIFSRLTYEANMLRSKSPPSPFPIYGSRRIRLWHVLVGTAVVLIATEIWGLPHLRTTYEYRGPAKNPTIISATYWSVTGPRRVHYSEIGDNMPVVAMLPLEKSLLIYAKEALASILSYAADQLNAKEKDS